MKKYLIFSALYYPNLGGVENYTYHLSKELIKEGHEVTLVTSNVYNLSEYEEIDRLKIYRVPCFNLLNGRFPVLKYNKKCRSLNKEIWNIDYDLVIINTRFYIHSLYAAFMAFRKKMKVIVIEHGATHFSIASPFWDKLGHVYEHVETSILKLFCKEYYGVSLKSNEWLKHFRIQSKGVLYDAIDLEYINKYEREINALKITRNFKAEDKIIAFVGRLITQKGVIQLIEAMREIKNKYPEWKLVIAGDGPLNEIIQKEKDDNVICLGKIEHDEVISLLSRSEIFCLPSDEEGFCLAAVEAIATKTYVVSTDVGIVSEIITNNNYGTILKSNSCEDIIEGLENAICLNNRKIVEDNAYIKLKEMGLSWDQLAKKIIEISKVN